MEEDVARCSAEVFQRYRVRATAGATGILVYVSLYERMVRVVGDDVIAAQVEAPTWTDVADLVRGGMQRGDPVGGLTVGILHCG